MLDHRKNVTLHIKQVSEDLVNYILAEDKPIDELQKSLLDMLDKANTAYNSYYYSNRLLQTAEACIYYFTKKRHTFIAETKTAFEKAADYFEFLSIVSNFFKEGGYDGSSVNSHFLDQLIEHTGGYKTIQEDDIASLNELTKTQDKNSVRASVRKLLADAFVLHAKGALQRNQNEMKLIAARKYQPLNISTIQVTAAFQEQISKKFQVEEPPLEKVPLGPPISRGTPLDETKIAGVRKVLSTIFTTEKIAEQAKIVAEGESRANVEVGKLADKYGEAIEKVGNVL